MNIDLGEDAEELGRVARKALEAAGGDGLAEQAEADPDGRAARVAPVLEGLGAWDLDVRGSADELEAAAALCRSAGWWATPYPVAERLARPRDLDVDGLVVVGDVEPKGAVDRLELRWATIDLDGHRSVATARPSEASARTSAFVTALDLVPVDDGTTTDVALGLVLPCWTLLGMLDRALALTCAYVRDRQQFGQALAAFQGVQFQLTDAEVERTGVEQLARYALWSVACGGPGAVADALALRLAALDAAEVVFRTCHQLHGAIGFCDETTISWISRASQPLRRLPFGGAGTQHRLAAHLGRRGLTGLYSGTDGP